MSWASEARANNVFVSWYNKLENLNSKEETLNLQT